MPSEIMVMEAKTAKDIEDKINQALVTIANEGFSVISANLFFAEGKYRSFILYEEESLEDWSPE